MDTDSSNKSKIICYNHVKDSSLTYHLTMSCTDKLNMHDIICKAEESLYLVPGFVTNSNLTCCEPTVQITLPACETYVVEQQTIQIEKTNQTLCNNDIHNTQQIKNRHACELECLWSNTDKQANTTSAHAGDIISYTITFTNYSSMPLDMVWICDNVPQGVTVIPESIYPTPTPGETLQTGIALGSLGVNQTTKLTYSVIVDCGTTGDIMNCACVTYYYIDCKGCCHQGRGNCQSSIVKILPDDTKITIVKSANKNSVCRHCEEIIYTLKISNPNKVGLTDVFVYDNIPQGLCYKENSTSKNGEEPTDENPQNGIYIGQLPPDKIYTITFTLFVYEDPYCYNPDKFENTAYIHGNANGTTISAKSNRWIVTMNGKCFNYCMKLRFPICDICCLQSYFVYHTSASYYNMRIMKIIRAGFGIKIKYIDNYGKKKSKSIESNVLLPNLPDDFNPNDFTIRFTDLICDIDCNGNIIAKFKTTLCYCTTAKLT